MKLLFTNAIIFLVLATFAHPLHMSISNITISDGEIEVHVKSFADDIAQELNTIHRLNFDNNYYFQNSSGDSLLIKHFNNNFKLSLDGENIVLRLIKIELEDEQFVFSMKASCKSEIKQCKISNTLLMHIFHDQKNLLIVENRGVEKGIELNIDRQVAEFNFEE